MSVCRKPAAHWTQNPLGDWEMDSIVNQTTFRILSIIDPDVFQFASDTKKQQEIDTFTTTGTCEKHSRSLLHRLQTTSNWESTALKLGGFTGRKWKHFVEHIQT